MARLMLPHGRTTDARQGCAGSFAVNFIAVSGCPAISGQNAVR